MRLSALAYYARSIPKLLLGIQPLPQMVGLFLGRSFTPPLTITLRASGLKYRVRTAMDVWIIKETCLDRHYERGLALQDGWSIVDIGAGLGDFTAYASWRSPRGRVLAFEPDPESFALLEHNLQLNGTRNVEVRSCAVADVAGTLLLNVDSRHATNHSTTAPGIHAIEVPAITLAQVLDDHSLAHCDLLKLDAEGAEYGVLMGASRDTLRQIKRIALEYHDNTPAGKHDELVRFLQSNGFQVEVCPNPVHHYLGYLYAMQN
jgi:FkbM family methyltransferase